MSVNQHASPSTCWRLRGSEALLSAGSLTATVNVERPSQGLHDLRFAGEAIAGCVMGVGVETEYRKGPAPGLPCQPHDAYVRGCDLVATYREPLGQPFNMQVYWRVVEGSNDQLAMLDAIVSVQTPKWEAYPCICVNSALPSGELLVAPESVVFRTAADWSYAEVTRPGDFTIVHVDAPAEGLRGVHWRFGKEFMEKGVIRRLQLRGAVANADDAPSVVSRMREALLAEQPPLTA